jgi:hypothetical protein
MTKLNGHGLKRETAIEIRTGRARRPLIVELFAGYLTVRPKGMRRRYSVPWDAVYSVGAKMEAAARAKMKPAARESQG